MIRKNHLYFALTTVALGLFGYYVLGLHTPFDWQPSFAPQSKEPFGCSLFDEYLEYNMPQGYEVKDDLPDSLDVRHNAVLYTKFTLGYWSRHVTDNYEQEVLRARRLMDFAQRGGKVIVATTSIKPEEKDSLHIAYGLTSPAHPSYQEYNSELTHLVNEQKTKLRIKKNLLWAADKRPFAMNELLVMGNQMNLMINPEQHQILMFRDYYSGDVVAIRQTFKSGGEIIFVATPLLFSNFAIMDSQAIEPATRLLRLVDDRHLVRILGKNQTREKHNIFTADQFSWIRSNPSLMKGFQVLFYTLLLALLFLSRRRMRAIPLQTREKNVTLEFAKTMGTFHYRQHDHVSLLIDQFNILFNRLGETMSDDVERLSIDELKRAILQRAPDVPEREVNLLLKTMKVLEEPNTTITQEEMMELLDIIRKIKEEL